MWVLRCVKVCGYVCVCVWGGGGVGYCIFSWKRHIYDYNDRFDLWVDMGKFYLYLLGCCLEVPPKMSPFILRCFRDLFVSFYS